MKSILCILFIAVAVMGTDLSYYDPSGSLHYSSNEFVGVNFDLTDFGDYNAIEVHEITVIFDDNYQGANDATIYLCAMHNPYPTHIRFEESVVGRDTAVVTLPEPILLYYPSVVVEQGVGPLARVNFRETMGENHSIGGEWGSWASMVHECEITLTGYIWESELSQATWGSIKSGF